MVAWHLFDIIPKKNVLVYQPSKDQIVITIWKRKRFKRDFLLIILKRMDILMIILVIIAQAPTAADDEKLTKLRGELTCKKEII